jgi:hypothetical protein
MAGKADDGCTVTVAGPEVFHRAAIEPLAGKPCLRQARREQIEGAAVIWSDGSAGNETLRELERLIAC